MSRLFIMLTMLVLISLATAAGAKPHTFRYVPDQPVRSVNLAGSFNGWSMDATPMRVVEDGVYAATVDLEEGVHFYKFVVDGNRWVNDPQSMTEFEQPDGHGGMNSAVFIGLDGRTLPAPRPGHIRVEALEHDPAEQAQPVDDGEVLLTVRTQHNDVDAVNVIYEDAAGERKSLPLRPVEQRMGFDYYRALLKADETVVRYTFEVRDDGEVVTLDANGQPFMVATDAEFETPEWARDAIWYQIFTERFRNGESSNDPGGVPGERLIRWQSDWWTTQPGEAPGAENFYAGRGNVWQRRYGGDLQGVREALPYLRRLGVNAIYFNPLFEGESMHKYDASDFRHIDDNFGVKGDLPVAGEGDDPSTWKWSASDRVFLDFLNEAHAQGFKVIIDGVFNHTGTAHFAFQDVLKHGRESRYADWFEITDWGTPGGVPGQPGGIQWRAWDGPSGALPVFKKDAELGLAEGPREHIFAVTKRWMDPNGDGDPADGIDGWRLDVPGDIPHPFWRDWRKLVKGTNPDAYISGEIWSLAHPWLEGDQFDAVMNYQFAMAGQDFFVDKSTATEPSQFVERLNRIVYGYPLQVSLVQQNLYDSHDTDRLASMFVNPDRPYDGANRLQDNGPDYRKRQPIREEWQRMRQAVAFQMTFLGAPMIYYGDEAGMWSPDDPSNRQPMVWQDLEPYDNPQVRFNVDMFGWYQRMIAIRRSVPALRDGLFRPVIADDARDLVVFARDGQDASVYVAMNRSGHTQTVRVPVSAERYVDVADPDVAAVVEESIAVDTRPTIEIRGDVPVLEAEHGEVDVTIAPYGTAVLVPRS